MMVKNDLAVFAWYGYNIPIKQRAKDIVKAGFSHVMLWWGDEYIKTEITPKEEQVLLFRWYGLKIENVHLPFDGCNLLWTDTHEGDAVYRRLHKGIDDCRTYDIDTAVIHLTQGENPPPVSRIGLDRVYRLAEFAERVGVNIALENLRGITHLDAVYDSIRLPSLKFCYDSGHEHCKTPEIDLLEKYGSRLVALHLHDNNGISDQHMLPFEGSVDWVRVMKHLRRLGYDRPLGFEIAAENPVDKGYTSLEYLQELYSRARNRLELL